MKDEIKQYTVKKINYDEKGNIISFEVNIKGVNFRINRIYNKFKPTRRFEFYEFIEFNENNTKSIEIGWDTSAHGLQSLADQIGLKLINSTGSYSMNGKKPYFIEK